MTTDRELLRRYVQEASEEAFTEIVRRHVDLVYGAALRQLCGNSSLAQDVTQAVFTALAAKADILPNMKHLSAWLYTTTRFMVSHTVRTERRRQAREQKAQSMHALLGEPEPPDKLAVPPKLLDEVLARLDERDREAILLRFFEGQSFSAIGLATEVSEDAARMRVTRALEKIRMLFAKHGITSSTAAAGAALTGQVVAAPANLTAIISTTALAGSAAIAATTSAKAGMISLMMSTKTTAWVASAALAFALGYSGYQHREATLRGEETARLTRERDRLEAALKQSEQRSGQFDLRATQAEQRSAELQRKLNGVLATKPLGETSRALVAPDQTRTRVAERMAQMKPLLEQGMPIKGAVVVLVDGKPVQRQVEFVMGRETRIETVDDGTYIVTPSLNSDGSVKYAIALSKAQLNGGPEHTEALPAIIQTPWGGFTLGSGSGKVMAFDPDNG